MLTPLADRDGAPPEFRMILAFLFDRLSTSWREGDDFRESERAAAEAVRRAKALVERFPDDNNCRYVLASACHTQGLLLATDGFRLADAEQAHDDAIALLARLAAEFPLMAGYRDTLASAYDGRGSARAVGRPDEAEADFHHAEEILDKLVRKFPYVPAYQCHLGRTLGNRGRLALDWGRPGEALLRKAITYQERVLNASPRSHEARRLLERHKADLARSARH
jgi:predicted Zn-dependent protease